MLTDVVLPPPSLGVTVLPQSSSVRLLQYVSATIVGLLSTKSQIIPIKLLVSL